MTQVTESGYIIGVDPGRDKCGVAVVSLQGESVARLITSPVELEKQVLALCERYEPRAIVVGDRTGSAAARARLEQAMQNRGTDKPMIPVVPVAEHLSSVEARRQYLLDHRVGWRRLIPVGMQTPTEPFDDYTAEVLARRYLANL